MSKFEKTARVNVPGGNGTQAVVIDITESVVGFPVYTLRWLTDAGEPITGSCGEGDLAKANPTDAEIAARANHAAGEFVEYLHPKRIIGRIPGWRRKSAHAGRQRKRKASKRKR